LEIALVVGFGLVLSAGTVRRLLRLEGQTRSLSTQLLRAQEEERRSIARELHDEIGQAVSGLVLDVGRVASATDSEDVRSQLAAIGASAERTVDAVRRIALSLRPSMLDDLGLVPALEWQAREVGNRTALRTCIYRVTQEALQNCARHAGASRVRVGLSKAPHTVSLQVADNGKGFSSGRIRGLGLLGMEERVIQLGGRFRVQSESGHGTTVTAEWPL
jgi:signal transduction histidine kinase